MRTVLLSLLLAACGAAAQPAIDINQADEAALDSIRGIGPAMSSRIIEERRKAPFSSWADLMSRVKGIGAATAGRWSSQGLTVHGAGFPGAAPAAATTPASAAGH
ncbi:MAG: DUF655 domain-containing protein [Rhodoferax sp.]|nr:DUF655 domain-containing protein [Rhodoferax sp.]